MKLEAMLDSDTLTRLRKLVNLPEPEEIDPRVATSEAAARKNGDRWAVMWSVHRRGADKGCHETHHQERTFICERYARAFAERIAFRTRYHGILVEYRPRFRGWDAVMAGECEAS